ncbi:MAG: hypothetical protein A2655_02290 [Candidatus Yanofskybacteria bacterium RIFCSPHIGHO2_01_FULL_43_42]|uniref:Septum formation initiator n=1 Tax=Candidatus Yanofskybacteria bacterium RIFCSPLOWO2_01_FULL_43_22 TaxID=1802695 RepID=A0A1F8GJ15_9BACT|nr:MAG: hypothetical protein A2655_02290 [Candidatus Yanofskybacteria bacterium RIFCSPHIGHO2_01_FULL_43_42]OGN13292.1 MAG: hypothetical protein A3D48_03195 [Candidatus Yanofskybacteria bacterium RIFCSPHIGHO2_02_FULL_43_17]OGN24708.1 MAG: hypothetical protein A3A13_01420 [Candidatus Yanofskybacteria bacterium RIFCSPLOWO2_01_FULL_43_22]
MNLLNSKFFTVFISLALVWILFSVIFVEIEKNEVKKEEEDIEAKITNIERDNASLEAYIKNIENSEFLEKEARLRLNYKAPGEEVVFVHRDLNPQKASLAQEFSTDEPPNYKKWWNWLLGF